MGFNSGFKGLNITASGIHRYHWGLGGERNYVNLHRFEYTAGVLVCTIVFHSGCNSFLIPFMHRCRLMNDIRMCTLQFIERSFEVWRAV